MNKAINMQKLKAAGVAVLDTVVGCGIMLMIPGISESTAAMVGAAVAMTLVDSYMSRQSVAGLA